MAAFTVPVVPRRRVSRRRGAAEYLTMAAITVAIFTAGVFVFERVTNVSLVARIFEGTIAARTRADYSMSFVPRVKPVRSTIVVAATATAAPSR